MLDGVCHTNPWSLRQPSSIKKQRNAQTTAHLAAHYDQISEANTHSRARGRDSSADSSRKGQAKAAQTVAAPLGDDFKQEGHSGCMMARPTGSRPSLHHTEGSEPFNLQAKGQSQPRVSRFDGQVIEEELKVFSVQLTEGFGAKWKG
uniref:Uncharacterized protein n=1 Tax=Opuntia streptacantha TaxID=393608 RepID=A0A7C9AZZ4_OPUST